MLLLKRKCKNNDINTIRTSSESHLHWKKHFHENQLHFRVYVDFEADNQIDKASSGNKTTYIYKQNPVINGYHIISELDDSLKKWFL